MFFRNKLKSPKPGDTFAVTTGLYIGEFFVFIEESNNEYNFLSLPKMIIRSVPSVNHNHALKNKIISFVERLPSYVFQVCQLQYKKNKNSKTTVIPSLSG